MSELNLTISSLISKDLNFSGTELVELGIALVTQLFCVLLIIILFRTYPFHVHLWILMMNLVITLMIYTSLRLIIILYHLYKFYLSYQFINWIYMLRYIALFQESFTVFAIVGERSCAAKFSKKYEKVKFNIIPICVIFIGWLLSSLLVIYSLNFDVIPFIFVLGVVLFIWISATISMIILYLRLRQKRKERMQKWIAKKHTLSRRYQIKENIKSTRFLLPVISFLTVTSCTCMVILLLSYHMHLINIRIFDFVLSVRSLIVPIIVARGHCAFRNQLVALLATATNLVSSSDTETLHSRATRSGGQVYAVMSTVDMHFQSLKNAWEMTQSISRH